jgi:hypothetical protein
LALAVTGSRLVNFFFPLSKSRKLLSLQQQQLGC